MNACNGRCRHGTHTVTITATLVLAFTLPAAWGAAPRLQGPSSDEITVSDCRAVFAFPSADQEAVRAVAGMSDDWTIVTDDADRATLAIVTLSCDRRDTATNQADLIYTSISVFVDPPTRLAERSTSSFAGVSGETDFYLISWTTNDVDFASWLRDGTGLEDRVHYVRDLSFDYDVIKGKFRFEAGPGSQPVFTLDATAPEPAVFVPELTSNFWAETRFGDVMIETANPTGDRVGPSEWTLTARQGSELARMMGTEIASDISEIGTEYTFLARYRKSIAESCSPAERDAFLQFEQERVLDLIGDLKTLTSEADLVRLARPNPESGTVYNFYDHGFATAEGMGWAVVNTGEVGPGKPDVLLYAPAPGADATDPYGPDFPYELRGWAYARPYEPKAVPTFLGPCISPFEWFVHERGVHPVQDWTHYSVPPHEHEQGAESAHLPPLPTECAPICPVGFSHGRLWDIHFWLGESAASISMTHPSEEIPGFEVDLQRDFFYPPSHTKS